MAIPRVILLSLLFACGASAQTIRVGVAISLKESMTQIESAYESAGNSKVELVFGSSGQIQSHIINGADIDVFISAANKQVDELTRQGLVLADTRRVVARNSVVLIVPADAKNPPTDFQSLAGACIKRLAIGEPSTVPAGTYAMQVLKNLNLADKLRDRTVYGANVRQVLSYVERGEVSAGIVYGTDAKESGDKVKVVAVADRTMHEPVEYPAVIVKASTKQNDAKKFLDFLTSDKAKAILSANGFTTSAAAELAKTSAAE
jgi:molybdate transport system substrate-binding protein